MKKIIKKQKLNINAIISKTVADIYIYIYIYIQYI